MEEVKGWCSPCLEAAEDGRQSWGWQSFKGEEVRGSPAGVQQRLTLPGDPLGFAGQGRLDAPRGGHGEGLGEGGVEAVGGGVGGGGGDVLHAVHTVGLPVLPGGFLRLESVEAQSGVAGTELGRGEALGWGRRGLLTLKY